jgi:hypothetical protein
MLNFLILGNHISLYHILTSLNSDIFSFNYQFNFHNLGIPIILESLTIFDYLSFDNYIL